MKIRRSMSRLLGTTLVVSVVVLLFVLAAAAQSTTTVQFNGAFASVSTCSDTACQFVYVAQSVVAGSKTASLSYDLVFYLQDGTTYEITGFGNIPLSAFTINGNSAAVNVDTSAIAGFVTDACAYHPDGTVDCAYNITGGPVNIAWKTTRATFTSKTSGSSSTQSVGYKFAINGTSDAIGATPSGSVLGFPLIPGGQNFVGTSHNVFANIQLHK